MWQTFEVNEMKTTSGRYEKMSCRYLQMKPFLEQSRLDDPGHIYFHAGKQGVKSASIHCFNREGHALSLPPEASSNIALGIRLMDDNKLKTDPCGMHLGTFLSQVNITNSFEEIIGIDNIGTADYYLFIEFIPMSVEAYVRALKTAQCQVKLCKQQIKLFFVNRFWDGETDLQRRTVEWLTASR